MDRTDAIAMRRPRIVGAMLGAMLALPLAVLAEGSRQSAEIIVPDSHTWAYENWGFAAAVVKDDVVYVSGVVTFLEGEGSYEERYARGFRSALVEIDNILSEAGASLDDVVDITTYHTDLARQIETAVAVRMEVMNEPHPAWTAVGTTALAVPDGVTEIKVIAHRSD
ncbi:MAG: Rid family hydrolase [Woeseiaceae bacterium]|nr:Rid family hydrolase [Woeseiaceae bacterium]